MRFYGYILHTIILWIISTNCYSQKPIDKDFLVANTLKKYHDYYRIGFSARATIGNWMPTNKLSVLGNKTYWGVQLGIFESEVLSLRIAFESNSQHPGNTRQAYVHMQSNKPIISDTIYHIGRSYCELEYSFYHFKRLTCNAGIDLGQSRIILSQDSTKKEYKSESFLFGIYIGSKFYVTRWMPLFVQCKYSYLDHFNYNGTSLKGDAISYNAGLCFIIPFNKRVKNN